MATDQYKTNYEHFVSERPLDSTFLSKLKLHLCEDIDELKSILEQHNDEKVIGWDTETDGLNFEVCQIVGFSFSYDGVEGWYVPVRHRVGTNVDPQEAFKLFYDHIITRLNLLYNMRFDIRMYRKEGYEFSKLKYFDVQVGVYLADTNWKKTGLKSAERRFLGWDPDTFTETVGSAVDFSYLDPREGGYTYAALDAVATVAVGKHVLRFYQESKVSGRVHNEVMYHLMLCEDTLIDLDRKYYEDMEITAIEHLKTLEHEIMQMIGYPIKLNSNRQLGDALKRLGIDTGYYTPSGQMKVDIASLNSANLKDPHPILKKLIEYSKSFKEYNSYILPFLKQCREHDDTARFNFKGCIAPTMRLASGGDKGNAFFAPINIMAIPKPHPRNWYVHEYHGEELGQYEEVILGQRLSLTDPSPIMTEGQDPVNNIRYGIVPPKGRIGVSCDYAAQELRMQANLAYVKEWCEAFNTGDDLHKRMAVSMWGEENYDKARRKMAKALNFGNLYGMSAYTLAEREHIPIEEAEDICNRWWDAVPEIKRYQDYQYREAKKSGTQYNYFGFPRRVKFYLDSDDPKKRAFGRRTLGNNPIQSTCAVMTQASLISVSKALYESEEWKDRCSFFSFVHDEIDSSVNEEDVIEFVNIQHNLQTKRFPNMPVTFETSCALFHHWGAEFEYDWILDESEEAKAEGWKFGKVIGLKLQTFDNPRWNHEENREYTDEEWDKLNAKDEPEVEEVEEEMPEEEIDEF